MANESVIVWLLALVPGLLLGRWMAMWLATSYQSDLLNFRIYVSASSYILTAAGIIITMLLAALPAIRRVNRLNLGEATKVFQLEIVILRSAATKNLSIIQILRLRLRMTGRRNQVPPTRSGPAPLQPLRLPK